MPDVALWKSKPKWRATPKREQDQVVENLRALVSRHIEPDDTSAGPYVHHEDDGWLLIWHVKPEYAEQLRADYERILGLYFEPLMYGTAENLTARDYYEGLSKPSKRPV